VSTGALEGLNVGYGSNDDRSAIDENRRIAVASLLRDGELVTLHQVHSAEVVQAERPWPRDARPRADAMVTDRPNLLLGILTADCAPVLFADHGAPIVGAAHAGWRGALAGVTDSTIAAMKATTAVQSTTTPTAFAYRFDRAFMALDAAVQGLGVALESTSIGEPHLRNGRLRPVFHQPWFLPVQAHFLVYPARHAQRSEVVNFVKWLREKANSPASRQ